MQRPITRHVERLNRSLHQVLLSTHRRWSRKIVVVTGDEGYQENMVHWINSAGLIWDHRDWNSKHGACTGLNKSSPYMLCLLVWCFHGTANCRSRCVSLFCLLLGVFPPVRLPSPALVWQFLPCLILFCFVVFGGCLLEDCSFLMRVGGGLDMGREEKAWEE